MDSCAGAGFGKGGGKGHMLPQNAWVKIWDDEKGFGFITSANAEDIYVHRTVLTDGVSLVPGTQVWFEAHWNYERNKWQATSCSGASGDGKGTSTGSGPSKGTWNCGSPTRGSATAPTVMSPGVQAGKVKMWDDSKGFGFVTPDAGGTDVFVHRKALSDGTMLVVGNQVVFDLQWDEHRGKYLARSCSGAVQGQGGPMGGQQGGQNQPFGDGYGKVLGGLGMGNNRFIPYDSPPSMMQQMSMQSGHHPDGSSDAEAAMQQQQMQMMLAMMAMQSSPGVGLGPPMGPMPMPTPGTGPSVGGSQLSLTAGSTPSQGGTQVQSSEAVVTARDASQAAAAAAAAAKAEVEASLAAIAAMAAGVGAAAGLTADGSGLQNLVAPPSFDEVMSMPVEVATAPVVGTPSTVAEALLGVATFDASGTASSEAVPMATEEEAPAAVATSETAAVPAVVLAAASGAEPAADPAAEAAVPASEPADRAAEEAANSAADAIVEPPAQRDAAPVAGTTPGSTSEVVAEAPLSAS